MATSAAAKAGQTGKRIEVSIKKAIGPGDDKVHTWPHLVRAEFICALLVRFGMIVWALMLDAPLEEPANTSRTPNPSKAPWYFLGLQEMLVFFDPPKAEAEAAVRRLRELRLERDAAHPENRRCDKGPDRRGHQRRDQQRREQ